MNKCANFGRKQLDLMSANDLVAVTMSPCS